MQRKHRVVLEADMGEGLDTARSRDGQSDQGPAVIETVPDQGRKLRGDAFVGCFFQEAMQGTDLGKSPCQTQPATQAQPPPRYRWRPETFDDPRYSIYTLYAGQPP